VSERVSESSSAVPALPPRIVLYDGVCGLCHRAVAWLLRHDRARAFRYAPLQGETAARLRAEHPEIPVELETVVYVEDGRVYLRSHAFLQLARHLPAPWRWAHAFRWLPAWLVDWAYNLVARVRYRVWGKLDTCQVPSTAERALLLP
jgi:predicted DCC family thiol-disulfide oxidoreductase YuxK